MNENKSKANDIKHRVRKHGMTLKEWSAANGFKYRDVSDVVRGIRFGNYGVGRDIREKLEELTSEVDHPKNEVVNLSGQLDLLVDHSQHTDK
jgi:gp16 family phage-associated protein